jgi:hypothetical protein
MHYENMARQNNTEGEVTENDGAWDDDYDDDEVGDDDDDNEAEVAMALVYLGSANNF